MTPKINVTGNVSLGNKAQAIYAIASEDANGSCEVLPPRLSAVIERTGGNAQFLHEIITRLQHHLDRVLGPEARDGGCEANKQATSGELYELEVRVGLTTDLLYSLNNQVNRLSEL